MSAQDLAEPFRSLAPAPSRRGFVAALASGLLGVGPLALGHNESLSKGKRKNQKRRKRKKQTTLSPPSPLPPPSGPGLRPVASCLGTSTVSLGGPGNRRVAQTFTAVASGPLVRADIQIRKEAESIGDYFLHLGAVNAFGVPTNEVLAFTSLANINVPDGASTISFSFANPAAVVAGVRYALVLTRAGSGALGWEGSLGDTCAGQAFFSLDQTAPFDTSVGEIDLHFTAFVQS
jgi:hypothetical protein